MRHLVVAGGGRGLSDPALNLGTWTLTFRALPDPAGLLPSALCLRRPHECFLCPDRCCFQNPKQKPRGLQGQEAVGRNQLFKNEGRLDAGDPANGPHQSSVGLESVSTLQTDSVQPVEGLGRGLSWALARGRV